MNKKILLLVLLLTSCFNLTSDNNSEGSPFNSGYKYTNEEDFTKTKKDEKSYKYEPDYDYDYDYDWSKFFGKSGGYGTGSSYGSKKNGSYGGSSAKPKEEGKDYYKILGVDKNATDKEIKKAYIKLMRKWHPDKNKDNKEEAEKITKELNEAYQEVLSQENRKNYYDEKGKEAFAKWKSRGYKW